MVFSDKEVADKRGGEETGEREDVGKGVDVFVERWRKRSPDAVGEGPPEGWRVSPLYNMTAEEGRARGCNVQNDNESRNGQSMKRIGLSRTASCHLALVHRRHCIFGCSRTSGPAAPRTCVGQAAMSDPATTFDGRQ